jgi:plasmid stabilization system protein ParE
VTAFLNPESTMPRWSEKDERQYEHIKDSSRERGASPRRAKEIAARTVNKTRRQQGRTENRTTQGTGNPNKALEDRTVAELRNIASDRGIEGRSSMRKADLVRAIRSGR